MNDTSSTNLPSKSPVRILHAVPSLGLANGVAAVVMNWYREIDRSKVQFDFLVCYEREKSYESEIKKLGGRVYTMPSPRRRPLGFLASAYKIFKEGNYSVFHSHVTQYNFLFFPLARIYGVKKIILHSHNPKYSDSKIKGFFAGLMLACVKNMADVKAACSEKAGDFLFGKNAKYEILNNAVDCKKFAFNSHKRAEIRAKLGLGESDLVLGHIGRFCEQKNQLFLLDVFAELLKRRPDCKLIMAGMGPLEQATKEKAKSLGMEKNTLFMGVYDKPEDLYRAMDIFVLPSLYEGFGLVAAEAQACGLPCFISDEVPDNVHIIHTFKISLKNSPARWADIILANTKTFIRKDESLTIEQAGFGVKSIINKLNDFYGTALNEK